MSYYDSNYWRYVRRYYPYVDPSFQVFRPSDPIQQLGLSKNEVMLTSCVFCGEYLPVTYRTCPRCGCSRGF